MTYTERVQEFFEHKVAEWMNDGEAEVVRVLTIWATRDADEDPNFPRLDLGPYLEEYKELDGLDEDDSEKGGEK